MYQRSLVPALALAVGLAGCDASEIVEPSVSPSFAAVGQGASVSGSGHFSLGDGESRIFTFSAREGGNGNVSGQFTLTRTISGFGSENPAILNLQAEVVCLTVVGNRAWVGGVVNSSSNPDWVGGELGWAVEDDGEGPASVDLISLVNVPNRTPGYAQAVCDNKARVPAVAIERGNVSVIGDGGVVASPDPKTIVSGGGTVETASGRSTYAFHALVDGSGSTDGQFEIHFSSVPWELHGSVTCAVVVGGQARLGAVIERSDATNPNWQEGGEFIWFASDGGEGANAAPDQVSSFFRHDSSDCTAPTFNVKDWTNGNVQIRTVGRIVPTDVPDRLSLESVNYPGFFVRHAGFVGFISPIDEGSSDLEKADATFETSSGLADPACVSLSSTAFNDPTLGRFFLRKEGPGSDRVVLQMDDGTAQFAADATFCTRDGNSLSRGVSLELYANPGFFIRHAGFQLWVHQVDGSELFDLDSTFEVREPWAGDGS